MKSVSSRIMAGQMIKGGTGMCDLMLDMEKLQNSEYVEDIDDKLAKNINELSTDATIKDIIDESNESDVGIFIPM